jgi:cyclic 2,3-diphosphoglycerate synthetase
MPERAIVLIDGEHYPPITRQMLAHVRASGREVVGAIFLGGTEKLITDEPILPDVTCVPASTPREFVEALARFHPDVAIDLSDEPIVSTTERLRIASVLMAEDVAYEGAGFRFDPPRAPALSDRHTISIIGSGKRTGKTAVSAALARHARSIGRVPLIVAMGRGGPQEPVITDGSVAPPTVDDLIARAAAGEHAATDAYEDAVVARCLTIGARRGGAGFSGAPMVHTVHDALHVAEALPHDLLLLEGSGTAIPPARADRTLYVIGARSTLRDLFSGLMPSRLLTADAIVCTGVDAPISIRDPDLGMALRERMLEELGTYPELIECVFRPEPLESIAGDRVFYATTAPEWTAPSLRAHLETLHGGKVVGITHQLSNRPALADELRAADGTYDVLLTEIKAAGIDLAARHARSIGARVVLCDNVPLPAADEDPDALATAFDRLLA